jgi:pimeloyl-ACP methyl ester carboxylesterase
MRTKKFGLAIILSIIGVVILGTIKSTSSSSVYAQVLQQVASTTDKPVFVYPVNGQTLDYEGAYLFKVQPIASAQGFLWGFFQNGVMVWENLRDEGTLSTNEYGILEGSLGHSKFSLGDVDVWVRASINGAWTDATVITIHLQPGATSFSISGRVADASGHAVSEVTVTAGTGHTVTTDANGNFTFTGLPKGRYQITPAKSGLAFSPVSSSINLNSNTTGVNFLGVTAYTLGNCRVIDEYGNPLSGARVTANSGQTTVTNSEGGFTLQVPAGQVTLYISKALFTFPVFTFPVSANIYERNFAGLGVSKTPIVFVHGWNSNAEQTFKDGPPRNVPDTLVQAGYHVEFANLLTAMGNTPAFQDNVERLKEAIESAKAATGRSKVIIIAHSMGGLVSRAYIEGPDYQNDVSELFTFGSPHLGTPLAVFNFFGAVGGPAVSQMTPGGMAAFNQQHRWNTSVRYHLIGGDAPMDVVIGQICIKFLWWTVTCWDNRVPTWMGGHAADRNIAGWLLGNMIAGQDDSFVSTDSATRLPGWIDRASSDEVHGRAFGDNTYFNRGFAGNSPMSRSFEECIKKVLIDKTTNTCGQWSWGARTPLIANGPVLPSQPEVQTPSGQNTPILTGKLHSGERITQTLLIDGGETSFAAHWTSGSAVVTLVDPNGQTIDPSFAARNPDHIFYGGDSSTALYDFRDAFPGAWKLVLSGGSDIPAEGSDYSVLAAMQSMLAVSFQMEKIWYAAGDLARVSASFSEITSGNTVTATLRYGDGSSATVSLMPKGPGRYEGSVVVADIPGYTTVHVQAIGINANGSPFDRADDLLFQVAPHSAAFNTTYAEALEPRPEDPTLYSALTVTVGINSAIDGQIGLSGDLVDAASGFIAHSIARQDATLGANTLALRFEGSAIFAARKNGPYHLTNLLLTDEREAPLVITETIEAYTTAAYDYRSFADRHAFPTVSAGGPYALGVGAAISLTATGNDPENDPLTFAWNLDDDGVFETLGQSVTFSTADISRPGTFNLNVQVADANGYAAIDQTTLDVLNVPPVVAAGVDATIQPSTTLARIGTFTDPGTDTWTATVNYGDGTGPHPLALTGKQFELNHLYADLGLYLVTVTVGDDLDGVGAATFAVTVSKLPGDRDGDGVPDATDACPNSNLSPTVVLGTCDSGARNPVNAAGCTVFDQVARCSLGVRSHAEFVSLVSQLTGQLTQSGTISDAEAAAIQTCAARANIPYVPPLYLPIVRR